MNRSSLFKNLLISLLVTGLFLVGLFVFAAWQPPSDIPPNANVLAPINVGSVAQIKAGAFTALTLTASGGEIFANTGGTGHLEGDIKRVNKVIGDNDLLLYGNSTENAPIFLEGNPVVINNDAGTGNVGIGTASPDVKLHISNASSAVTMELGESGAGRDILRLESNPGSYKSIEAIDVGFWSRPLYLKSQYLSLYTGGGAVTERLRLSSTGGLSLGSSYVATDPGAGAMIISGNVGIGTPGPSNALHIRNSTAPQLFIENGVGGGTNAQIRFERGLGNYYWDVGMSSGQTSDFQFNSQTGGTILHLNYDGNVGIGTTSPGARLDVNGNTIFRGNISTILTAPTLTGINSLGSNPSMFHNWSFEVDSNGDNLPDGWEITDEAGTYSVSKNSANYRNGHYSVATQANGGAGNQVGIRSTCIPVTPSTTYNFAVDVKASAITAKGFWYRMYQYVDGCSTDAGLQYKTIGLGDAGISTSWTQKTGSVATDADTYFVKIKIGIYVPDVTSTFYLDRAIMWPNTWGGADLAEFMPAADETLISAGIVSLDPQTGKVIRSASEYDEKIIGIVSTKPAIIMDDENESFPKVPVALAGRVPVMVSIANGPIKIGDPITSSNIPGVGMKALKAGTIIGRALESFNPDNEEGQTVFCSLNSPPDVKCGKILAFINIFWYDPDMSLTDSGEIAISSLEGANKYQLENNQGDLINRIGRFSEAVIADLKTGLIETKKLIVDGMDIFEKLTEHETKIQAQQQELGEQKKQIEELKTEVEDLKKEIQQLKSANY